MIVLADENVDDAIVQGLRKHGVLVRRAAEAALRHVPDEALFATAVAEGWLLLTHDADFIAIARQHVAAGRTHAGVVYAHRDRITVGSCVRFVHKLLAGRGRTELRDTVHFVPWSRRPRRSHRP